MKFSYDTATERVGTKMGLACEHLQQSTTKNKNQSLTCDSIPCLYSHKHVSDFNLLIRLNHIKTSCFFLFFIFKSQFWIAEGNLGTPHLFICHKLLGTNRLSLHLSWSYLWQYQSQKTEMRHTPYFTLLPKSQNNTYIPTKNGQQDILKTTCYLLFYAIFQDYINTILLKLFHGFDNTLSFLRWVLLDFFTFYCLKKSHLLLQNAKRTYW